MKTAKIRVPIPKVPPKIQPSKTTENSMLNLTKLIGLSYLFDIPVIKPSDVLPSPFTRGRQHQLKFQLMNKKLKISLKKNNSHIYKLSI